MAWLPTTWKEFFSGVFPVILGIAFMAYIASIEGTFEDRKRVSDPEISDDTRTSDKSVGRRGGKNE